MKARIIATDEIIEVTKREERVGSIVYIVYATEDGELFQDTDLDFLPEKETAVLEGWVARDENEKLHLFMDVEPRRLTDEGRWWDRDYVSRELPQFSFPSVTWQSEPNKVRIILKAIEE